MGTQTRSIREIARDVRADWAKVNYAAEPYLAAMASLEGVGDTYGADDARGIVLYFLSNATSWRGPVARAIKAELKGMMR